MAVVGTQRTHKALICNQNFPLPFHYIELFVKAGKLLSTYYSNLSVLENDVEKLKMLSRCLSLHALIF